MLRTNNRRLSRRTHSFEKATPNPMENLANLVDVMLVFACALMIAIGTVLSNIKIFTMPNGGSVTLLSMLPFVLVSFRHGV